MEIISEERAYESSEMVTEKLNRPAACADLGGAAIACAGCPLARFCELKNRATTEEPIIPDLNVVEVEIDLRPDYLLNLDFMLETNLAVPIQKSHVSDSQPEIVSTPLPYEVKNTTQSYLDKLLDDRIEIVLADSLAPSRPYAKIDKFKKSDDLVPDRPSEQKASEPRTREMIGKNYAPKKVSTDEIINPKPLSAIDNIIINEPKIIDDHSPTVEIINHQSREELPGKIITPIEPIVLEAVEADVAEPEDIKELSTIISNFEPEVLAKPVPKTELVAEFNNIIIKPKPTLVQKSIVTNSSVFSPVREPAEVIHEDIIEEIAKQQAEIIKPIAVTMDEINYDVELIIGELATIDIEDKMPTSQRIMSTRIYDNPVDLESVVAEAILDGNDASRLESQFSQKVMPPVNRAIKLLRRLAIRHALFL